MRRPLPSQPAYDYGRCPCGGTYEPDTVDVPFQDPVLVLVEVPMAQCPSCSGRVYKTHVLEYVERVHRGDERGFEAHPLEHGAPAGA